MKLKGSYTVEAAAIISFCFLLFGSAVCISYTVFTECMEYVVQEEKDFDAVKTFRIKEGVVKLYNSVVKDE
ncbi:MAG: hypothetical protein K6E79_09540 [Pseudobutyrivibrio sp.]|nr:hypothetical protein [Pseudobutyrivibrio sp.]